MSQHISRSAPRIRQLRETDIPDALELCRIAGWNQTHADWQRLIEYGQSGCFAAVIEKQLAGTVTTTRYGTDLAWIGMMLVHPEFRRRGIGTLLMKKSLSYLLDKRVQCIKLDATPAGRPVYERLGFRAEWTFHRWQRPARDAMGHPTAARANDIYASSHVLDIEAFGCDRGAWLRLLAAQAKTRQSLGGFGMLRPGYLASYLGPVIATDISIAREIVGGLLDIVDRTVIWDVPQPNEAAVQLAGSLDFCATRELTRMWTGRRHLLPNMRLQYAIADPGTG